MSKARPRRPDRGEAEYELELDAADLKRQLLTNRVEAQRVPVEIEDLGTVYVRGLSRGEVFAVNKVCKKVLDSRGEEQPETEDLEAHIIARGMVEPTMTVAEVRRWQKGAPAGELDHVADTIRDLSGLGQGARKAAYKSVRDDTDAGVRVLPGQQAIDVGGQAPSGDE